MFILLCGQTIMTTVYKVRSGNNNNNNNNSINNINNNNNTSISWSCMVLDTVTIIPCIRDWEIGETEILTLSVLRLRWKRET